MIHPEKNDVNISKLFHWGSKFDVLDKYGNKVTDVYIRLVGDADINRARVFALRRSAEMRKALKTPGTDSREAFIATIYELETTDDVIQIVKSLYTRDIAQEAAKVVKIPQPKEPKSTASLEEQEEYQALVDSYQERREAALTEYVLNRLQDVENELKLLPLETLQKRYEKLMVDELCEREMIDKFREFCVYLGTYSDEEFKIPFFNSFEDFENLPNEIKAQLELHYDSLEINAEELKKLLGVTQ